MKPCEGGLGTVPGYSFSSIKAEIRYKDRLDFSLIASDTRCHCAGVFTTNKIFAAPVALCRERIGGPVKGILINATNANACTGDEGLRNARDLTAAVAGELGSEPESILMASTGIIGVQLPADKMRSAIPQLTGALSADNAGLIPLAIMTTDTIPKECAASFTTPRGEFHIAGTAKGAGMIAPNMATLLAFMITDAPVAKRDLDAVFMRCIDKSLNAITIDGDMSTNDSAFLLSPMSDSPLSEEGDLEEFEAALRYVTEKLAELIVTDAEGATKLARITVTGAASEEDARLAARAIAESMLVKTAMFGKDPNWGRIACAAGYSGANITEEKLTIRIEDAVLFTKGAPTEKNLEHLMEILGRRSYTIHVDLGIGNGTATYMTSDLSYDYVKINAEYST